MFSENLLRNKYLKYKSKYINLQKGGSAAASNPSRLPSSTSSGSPSVVPSGASSVVPSGASFGTPSTASNITNEELNQKYQSIGFEFEYFGLYINTSIKELFDALTKSHNKLKIKLPARYENIELEIGNDGPYINKLGQTYYNFEMNVTFKDRRSCVDIGACYNSALNICKQFIHDSFYIYQPHDIVHQPKKQRSDPTIQYKHKILDLYITPNNQEAPLNSCLSQCTFGILYNDIKKVFSIILQDPKYFDIYIYLDNNEKLFMDIFGNDLVMLKNKEQTSEIQKQIIKIENWIYLISYYYTCIHNFSKAKLFKTLIPLLLRHGLISIMPPELKETMAKIKLNENIQKKTGYNIIEETFSNMKNGVNNYLYYLYKFNEFPDFEKSIIVRLNNNNRLIYEPHESNYFDFKNDILYVEYRKFFLDDILMQERDHNSTCYDYLDLSNLATTNDNTTTFIIDEPNKIDVISKIGKLESKSIFETAISGINSGLISNELDSKYFEAIKKIINRPLEHIVGSSAASMLD